MPLYLSEAAWDAQRPLDEALDGVEQLIQRTGGQLVQAMQLEDALSLTIEVPDDLSLFRVMREASALGLQIRSRPALPRVEAEALDQAHRQRSARPD